MFVLYFSCFIIDIQNHTIDGVVVECKKATPQEKDMRSMRNRGMQERMRNGELIEFTFESHK